MKKSTSIVIKIFLFFVVRLAIDSIYYIYLIVSVQGDKGAILHTCLFFAVSLLYIGLTMALMKVCYEDGEEWIHGKDLYIRLLHILLGVSLVLYDIFMVERFNNLDDWRVIDRFGGSLINAYVNKALFYITIGSGSIISILAIFDMFNLNPVKVNGYYLFDKSEYKRSNEFRNIGKNFRNYLGNAEYRTKYGLKKLDFPFVKNFFLCLAALLILFLVCFVFPFVEGNIGIGIFTIIISLLFIVFFIYLYIYTDASIYYTFIVDLFDCKKNSSNFSILLNEFCKQNNLSLDCNNYFADSMNDIGLEFPVSSKFYVYGQWYFNEDNESEELSIFTDGTWECTSFYCGNKINSQSGVWRYKSRGELELSPFDTYGCTKTICLRKGEYGTKYVINVVTDKCFYRKKV